MDTQQAYEPHHTHEFVARWNTSSWQRMLHGNKNICCRSYRTTNRRMQRRVYSTTRAHWPPKNVFVSVTKNAATLGLVLTRLSCLIFCGLRTKAKELCHLPCVTLRTYGFFPITEDLPAQLWFFNGGFSCRSFSRLHPDAKNMKTAMKDDNQDGS